MPVMDKELPQASDNKKRLPKESKPVDMLPEETALRTDVPEAKELDKPKPAIMNPENVIHFPDKDVEVKPTKVKYQRNRTAAAYRILDLYPLPDVLAMDQGVLDPERDGDQIVFDFLVAVFDDSKLVSRYYDQLDTETIDRAVKIFKRLNHIDEKEEAAKNREAKGTSR